MNAHKKRWGLALCASVLIVAHAEERWTHFVRIGGYGLEPDNAGRIVRDATGTLVSGIEVDNDPTGRYESFLQPREELEALRSVAREAHQAGHKVFAYTAGWECITSGAAKKEHTLAKDHPDWLQRRLTGEPAVFGGGAAFWITRGDEDAWISPYAAEWRKVYMERIRQMTATGVDGIYVDVPYWMTHFDGWEETWASFDDSTVKAFHDRTGIDARKDFKLGDFEDAKFRRWVDFRMETVTEFMRELNRNVKSVNPDCATIAEIYPGIEDSAVSVGADVYELSQTVDAISHEYEPDNKLAAKKSEGDWFNYLAGICSFRAFAGGHASWMLGYSWEKKAKVKAAEPMQNLALAQVMAGANFWDAGGHEMSGSNDLATRREIFRWIRDNQARLYAPRSAMRPIGIYFSPNTRNYFAGEYVKAYKGALLAAMHAHREFQIVTPRDLDAFAGTTLVVADARCLSGREIAAMQRVSDTGRSLVVTGETGRYDETGAVRSQHVVWRETGGVTEPEQEVEVRASASVFAQIASVNGDPHVFLACFKGPEMNVRIKFRSLHEGHIYFTPYLGQTGELKPVNGEDGLTAAIPRLDKGGIVWAVRRP